MRPRDEPRRLLTVLPIRSGPVAGQAQAAGHNYGVVVKLESARLKACRTPIRQGHAFRVYAVLDNTADTQGEAVSATMTVRVTMTVTKRGTTTPESLETGRMKGGKAPKVYHLVVPRRAAFGLKAFTG